MKYTAIVGLNYRDCKAKLNSLNPSGEPVKHTLITKPNHVQGIPFSEVIVTENANKNVNYREIMGLLSNKPIKEQKKKEIVEDKKQLEINFEPEVMEEVKPEPEVDELPPVPQEEPEVEEVLEEEPEEEVLEEEPEEEVLEEEPEEDILEEEEPEEDNENEYIPEEEGVTITESEIEVEDESEEEDIKPAGDPPRGWHARNEFIDEAGNVFNKGKFVGNINDGE